MKKYELIIEGTVVDMGEATVSLEYISNILSGIDKISSSHSYTISLPLTQKNSMLFGYADSVSNRSELVGKYLSAEYRCNGITLLRNAKAYISGITPEAIEICLLWDGLARFTSWKEENPSLRALVYPSYVWSGEKTDYYDYYNDVVEAVYDSGVSEDDMPSTPCVNVASLLGKVMEGITDSWTYGVAGMQEELEHLFIPLARRGGTRAPSVGGQWGLIDYASGGYLDLRERSYGSLQYSASASGFSAKPFTAVNVIYDFEFVRSLATLGGTPKVNIFGKTSSTATPTLLHSTTATLSSTTRYKITDNVDLDVTGYEIVFFNINYVQNNFGCRGLFQIIPTTKLAVVGDSFDIGANLPEMTQADFIKAICAMFGCQLIDKKDGSLSFVSLDTVYGKVSSARDWTDKVVNWQRVPSEVKFSVGEFAQRNWLRYTEDDSTGLKSEACITVSNVSLDSEKDVAVLPFAPTAGGSVHHFEKKDGEIEDVEVKPRILRAYETDEGQLGLTFATSLEMNSIVSKWYMGLRRLLVYPVQIKVFARLNELDISALDWTVPVYLRQTGRYYAVMQVNSDTESDICEVTLIQL